MSGEGATCGCCEKRTLQSIGGSLVCRECDKTNLWSEKGRCQSKTMFIQQGEPSIIRCPSCTCTSSKRTWRGGSSEKGAT